MSPDAGDDSGIVMGAGDGGHEGAASDACVGSCASTDATSPADATSPPEAGSNNQLDATWDVGPGSDETADTGTNASADGASAEAATEAPCASGTDPNWASWPMPNVGSDVDVGAPNPQSYTNNGDGTITDKVTGLMWQQALSLAGTLSGSPGNDSPSSSNAIANVAVWSAAGASCRSLTLAGHNDWRLPTLIELVSIDQFGADPPLDPLAFSQPSAEASTWDPLFMSSTALAGTPNVWWIIHSDGGEVGYGSASNGQDLVFHCVRAPPPNQYACRYAHPNNGAVLDTDTGLSWQENAPTANMTQSDAAAYCATLSLYGGGWRVPTERELFTLIDFTTQYPLLDQTAFPGSFTNGSSGQPVYWSSTNEGILGQGDLSVRFDIGGSQIATGTPNAVRCVR